MYVHDLLGGRLTNMCTGGMCVDRPLQVAVRLRDLS